MIYEGSTVRDAIGLALGNKGKRFGKGKWPGQRQKPNAAKTRAVNESENDIRKNCEVWWRQYQNLLCEIDLHRKTRDCFESERDQIIQNLEDIERRANRIQPSILTLPLLNRHSVVLKQKGRRGRRPGGGTSAGQRFARELLEDIANFLDAVSGERDRRQLLELRNLAQQAQARLAIVESSLADEEDELNFQSQRIAGLELDPRMTKCRGIGDSTVGQYYCNTPTNCSVLTR